MLLDAFLQGLRILLLPRLHEAVTVVPQGGAGHRVVGPVAELPAAENALAKPRRLLEFIKLLQARDEDHHRVDLDVLVVGKVRVGLDPRQLFFQKGLHLPVFALGPHAIQKHLASLQRIGIVGAERRLQLLEEPSAQQLLFGAPIRFQQELREPLRNGDRPRVVFTQLLVVTFQHLHQEALHRQTLVLAPQIFGQRVGRGQRRQVVGAEGFIHARLRFPVQGLGLWSAPQALHAVGERRLVVERGGVQFAQLVLASLHQPALKRLDLIPELLGSEARHQAHDCLADVGVLKAEHLFLLAEDEFEEIPRLGVFLLSHGLQANCQVVRGGNGLCRCGAHRFIGSLHSLPPQGLGVRPLALVFETLGEAPHARERLGIGLATELLRGP
mmetsp:Transcript_25232/g.70353  ORF Transcript_25232/g.70353 Transcript_25232/m.70353 type:complete len:385 (-) Transcript_25232:652-1806(-)